MDTQILIKNLNQIFCQSNKTGKKFSEVWLSDVDFGGLYHNDKFVLNVKADHEIGSCKDEISDIIEMLDKDAKDELKFIWSVNIYGKNEQIHCASEEILVFNEANAC